MLGARMLGLFMKYTELVILTYYSQADIIAPVYPTSLVVNSSPGVPYYTHLLLLRAAADTAINGDQIDTNSLGSLHCSFQLCALLCQRQRVLALFVSNSF